MCSFGFITATTTAFFMTGSSLPEKSGFNDRKGLDCIASF